MTRNSRSNRSALSVRQLMADSEGGFGRVLQRARSLEQLSRQVSGLLDPDMARHCQLANVRDGRMIFACSSPGCATRLRMQAPDLLEQLHAAGMEDIDAIEVKMAPRV